MASDETFNDMGLSILGIGVQYPPHQLKADVLETLSQRFYPDSPSMRKVLSINRYTGIETRSSIGTADHPLVNQPQAPSVAELHQVFVSDGVPLAVEAARKAMEQSGVQLDEITHIVATTCTDNANPGFDNLVLEGLGLAERPIEKVLLQGVGCSGGLAILRTGANLALGRTARGRPARILCVALEVCTTLVRSELDSIDKLQQTRVGPVLFSDCASALVLSNDVGSQVEPMYELLGWLHRVIPQTSGHLRFDSDPSGWKVVLTPEVPKITCASMPHGFSSLLRSIPSIPPLFKDAADFDWALHPGGLTILTGAEKELRISSYHMRASYDTYMKHGNSSSATIFSVLNRLLAKDMDDIAPDSRPKPYVMACAFGPGVSVEMCALRRRKGVQSPLSSAREETASPDVLSELNELGLD